jgi:selenium-binding protein 1
MVPLGEVLKRPEPAKSFGHEMVVWNLHTLKPLQVLKVPGAPLEIRWALRPENRYAFTATALTHQLFLIHQKDDGSFEAAAVADLGDVLPVDISISANDRYLYVVGFMTGEVQQWDVSDPFHPKRLRTLKLGESANMISQSWDGRRLYVTNSLLSRWDKPGPFWMKKISVAADGSLALDPAVSVDFAGIGRPHQMNFGSRALYGAAPDAAPAPRTAAK